MKEFASYLSVSRQNQAEGDGACGREYLAMWTRVMEGRGVEEEEEEGVAEVGERVAGLGEGVEERGGVEGRWSSCICVGESLPITRER